MKKKLLFINGHLEAGGCERSLVDLLQHLDYSRYDVDLLLLEGLGDYAEEVPKDVHVKLFSLNYAFGIFGECLRRARKNKDWFSLKFRLIYSLSAILGKPILSLSRGLFSSCAGSYDAVIAFRQGICTDMAAYVFRGKKKISWWHHGEYIYDSRQTEQINRAFERVDAVVTVSKYCARLIQENLPHAEGKTHVIPNMVCIDRIIEKSGQPCEPSFPDAKLKIISVARFSPEKNIPLCVRVASMLRDRDISFSWILIGDGECYSDIQKAVAENDLADRVLLVGRKANPFPWINAADVMVHPSLVESQGISILEAMALSKPVIAVQSSGPMEYVENGKNGFLTEANASSIVTLIQMLIDDPDMAKAVSIQAKATAACFSPEQIIQKLEKELRLSV